MPPSGPRAKKPNSCLNIGFTYKGLKALELPSSALNSFARSPAFVQDAAARASIVGDNRDSDPAHWKDKWGTTEVHVLLTLHAQTTQERESQTQVLTGLLNQGEALSELGRCYDGNTLDDHREHFGFKDGLSQPRIAEIQPLESKAGAQDEQPPTPLGAFLLGYPSPWQDFSYPVPSPPELGRNGSFLAFRILEQDVKGFYEYLYEMERDETVRKLGLSAEKLAAKICGRWHDGTPLVRSPEKSSQNPTNNFDYSQDPYGYHCPFGAHIRRTNPRDDKIGGSDSQKRRIIRRGMPYGPRYNPGNRTAGGEVYRAVSGGEDNGKREGAGSLRIAAAQAVVK